MLIVLILGMPVGVFILSRSYTDFGWRTLKGWRGPMAHDLIERRLLDGMSSEQVVAKLGPPDDTTPAYPNAQVWDLGLLCWLIVDYGADGRVVSVTFASS